MKPKIHFAHGNGFPSSCYRQLLNVLECRYDCGYIDRIGHNPRYPVTENWDHLVDELLQSIREKYQEPIIGLGHSFGGILTLLAAIREPALFQAVVMLDSPVLGRLKSAMVRLAKSLGMIDRLTPGFRARTRKHFWQTREELVAYLKDKPLFKTFSPACIEDYVNFGFRKANDGYYLYFDRQIESQIFRTLPHHLPRHEGQLPVPGVLIYGDKSTVVDRFDVRYMTSRYHIRCYRMKGTHMLPMEYPEQVGRQIIQALEDIQPEA